MTDVKKILIIDENHADRSALRDQLENYGCHVSVLHTNDDVRDKMDSDNCPLIILSISAPGQPCIEFISRIKSAFPETDILVTSSIASVDEAVTVMKAGALDFLVKPIQPEKLFLFADSVFEKIQKEQGGTRKKRNESAVIITENPEMKNLLLMIDQVADSTASVLIQGESGTGKELFARYVHGKSNRKDAPFVAVNCAALPENLLESELFGHEKGAFTGAIARKAGKFELAAKGTILLDEITEMQMHLQAKLLRVLQEKEVDPLGSTMPLKTDVRVISTTNRDISKAIEDGSFREDLYYRLNVIPVKIPPLRERLNDVVLLSEFFIKKFNRLDGRNVKSLTNQAIDTLSRFYFKGNVRELENIIQRAVLLAQGETITNDGLLMNHRKAKNQEEIAPRQTLTDDMLASPLKDVERKMIMHTLEKTGGNRTHAAKILEISVRTLRNKLNEYRDKAKIVPE